MNTRKVFKSIFPCSAQNCLYLDFSTANSTIEERVENRLACGTVLCDSPKPTHDDRLICDCQLEQDLPSECLTSKWRNGPGDNRLFVVAIGITGIGSLEI